MAGEADQVPPIIIMPTADDNKSDSRTESDSSMASPPQRSYYKYGG
jgi:hypothetical protein